MLISLFQTERFPKIEENGAFDRNIRYSTKHLYTNKSEMQIQSLDCLFEKHISVYVYNQITRVISVD